jgi:hypothetical protein
MLSKNQQERRLHISNLTTLIAKEERFRLSIKDLKKGSYLSIKKENFVVLSYATYLETKWKNFKKKKEDYYITELKLFSLSTGMISYIEWEEDDEIEAYQTLKEIKATDIKCNGKNISRKIIEDISQEESGELTYNNESYYYEDEDTYAALYSNENYQDAAVKVYGFANKNEQYISIEFWYEEQDDAKPEKEVFLSKELDLSSLSVLQL